MWIIFGMDCNVINDDNNYNKKIVLMIMVILINFLVINVVKLIIKNFVEFKFFLYLFV